MSIIVNNTDNQLNINNNGVLDVYAVRSIKSVSRGVDASGNYYIAINFIANDKNNSLRIYLKDVSSPVTWTNDLAGANAALADIRDWLAEIIEVSISQTNDSILIYGYDGAVNRPVSVTSSGQVVVSGGTGVQRTPTFLRPTASNGTVAAGAFSVSFASVGTANAIVGGITLKPGETLNFDAGAINNTLASIAYDTTTNAGSELIIIKLT
jgi:hypothetical protein